MSQSKVKIGPITFEIVEVVNLSDDKSKLDGNVTFSDSRITVEAKLTPEYRRATVWHEIVHAILTQAGYYKHDEGQISALAYGIMNVLQDNPWLGIISSPDERREA